MLMFLSPLRGFRRLDAFQPGAHAPGYMLSSLRDWRHTATCAISPTLEIPIGFELTIGQSQDKSISQTGQRVATENGAVAEKFVVDWLAREWFQGCRYGQFVERRW